MRPTLAAGSATPLAFELRDGGEGRLSAAGELVFATARRACEQGLARLAGRTRGQALTIDCADIRAADSAGLAVLLEWLGAARAAGLSLRYTQIPADVRALAHISEVTELLEKGV